MVLDTAGRISKFSCRPQNSNNVFVPTHYLQGQTLSLDHVDHDVTTVDWCGTAVPHHFRTIFVCLDSATESGKMTAALNGLCRSRVQRFLRHTYPITSCTVLFSTHLIYPRCLSMVLVTIRLKTFSRAFVWLGDKPTTELENSFFPICQTLLVNWKQWSDTTLLGLPYVTMKSLIIRLVSFITVTIFRSNNKTICRNYAKNFFVAEQKGNTIL